MTTVNTNEVPARGAAVRSNRLIAELKTALDSAQKAQDMIRKQCDDESDCDMTAVTWHLREVLNRKRRGSAITKLTARNVVKSL